NFHRPLVAAVEIVVAGPADDDRAHDLIVDRDLGELAAAVLVVLRSAGGIGIAEPALRRQPAERTALPSAETLLVRKAEQRGQFVQGLGLFCVLIDAAGIRRRRNLAALLRSGFGRLLFLGA